MTDFPRYSLIEHNRLFDKWITGWWKWAHQNAKNSRMYSISRWHANDFCYGLEIQCIPKRSIWWAQTVYVKKKSILVLLEILNRYSVLFAIQEMLVFSDIIDSCKKIRLVDKALNSEKGKWLWIKILITRIWRSDRVCSFLVTSWLSYSAKLMDFQ